MSLTGTYTRLLDSKQRVALPKRLREALTGTDHATLYVAPESDRTLGLFTEAVFRQRAARLEALSGPPGHVKNYMRLYYAQAEPVEADSQGRIRIPERLIAFAGLREEVVLLGVHDHVEIWDQGAWDQFLAAHGEEFDQLARQAFA